MRNSLSSNRCCVCQNFAGVSINPSSDASQNNLISTRSLSRIAPDVLVKQLHVYESRHVSLSLPDPSFYESDDYRDVLTAAVVQLRPQPCERGGEAAWYAFRTCRGVLAWARGLHRASVTLCVLLYGEALQQKHISALRSSNAL